MLNSKVAEKFSLLLSESQIDLTQLENVTSRIVQVCTKDAIAVFFCKIDFKILEMKILKRF